MNTLLSDYLSRIELGEPQSFKGMTVLPAFTSANHTPDYLTLTEALERKLATISEVSAGGTVSEVKVTNSSELLLLLVEGEELIGARQNRTLNTSILLAGKSETVVPVSCTERGRWFYKTKTFSEASFMSPHNLRKVKSDSVRLALLRRKGFKSDQSAVWASVDKLCEGAAAHSPTSAMADAMEKMTGGLEECLKQFQPLPGQKGLVVLVNGEAVGMDAVSSAQAYRVLHPKFVRSYAMDALLQEKPVSADHPREKARAFLETAKTVVEHIHPAIGCGEDHRFESPEVAGASLLAGGRVVHLNLYRK